jgi:hypothetical protein
VGNQHHVLLNTVEHHKLADPGSLGHAEPDQPLAAGCLSCTGSAGSARSAGPGPRKLHMGPTEVILWHPGPSPGASRFAPAQKRVGAETCFTGGHEAGRSVPRERRARWRTANYTLHPTFHAASSQTGSNPSAPRPDPLRTLARPLPA